MTYRFPCARLVALVVMALGAPFGVQAESAKTIVPTKTITLFNGKDLTNFYTWLAEHKYEDPHRVFTVVDELDGAPAIRISGQEFQIIEGGTGDMLILGGHEKVDGPRILSSMTAPIRTMPLVGSPGKLATYWDEKGTATTMTSGRINWWGRDPEWKDVVNFRGSHDVEKPAGQWNRLEAIVEGDSMVFMVNGVKVNGGTNGNLTAGKLHFQSEGAELYYRKIELHPLKK